MSLCHCGCGQTTEVATRTRNGYVRGEHVRYMRGHAGRAAPHDYAVEDRGYDTPCWIWQLVTRDGYGLVYRGGSAQAHRLYYQTYVGKVPKGFEVDHLCGIKSCVNPDHLEAVTPSENCKRRSRRYAHESLVREVRHEIGLSQEELGVLLGMSQASVSRWESRA